MCFGGQPSAPTSHPAYAPEDAYKNFEVTEQADEAEKKKIPYVDDTGAKAPTVKTTGNNIRM